MLRSAGGDAFSGAILQFAATSMHSDSQLRQDSPHANNYVIDKLVAQSWRAKGFYDNALEKERQALKDIEVAAFPSQTEKDLAIAGVYESMAAAFDRLDQYSDMTAHEKAATALGGGAGFRHLICYGYDKLKSFETAVRECTSAIDETGSLKARFWRSRAYRDLGQADLALGDLTIVADSEDNFRTTAAIDISMNLFDRHDNRGALNALNKYSYLYDPATDSRGDIAVSYNNRCYAHMQLGELREALADCTASLKFGSLPDAYRKQAELLKRLGAHESGL
jgi:tetratricopeptide (TPR) repeat protein